MRIRIIKGLEGSRVYIAESRNPQHPKTLQATAMCKEDRHAALATLIADMTKTEGVDTSEYHAMYLRDVDIP